MDNQTSKAESGDNNDVTGEARAPVSNNNETLSVLERAERLNKETLEAEGRIAEHRAAIEAIETRRILGGRTEAGQVTKTAQELEDEEAQRLADEMMSVFKRK